MGNGTETAREREELKEDIEILLEKADYLLLMRIYLILARNT